MPSIVAPILPSATSWFVFLVSIETCIMIRMACFFLIAWADRKLVPLPQGEQRDAAARRLDVSGPLSALPPINGYVLSPIS